MSNDNPEKNCDYLIGRLQNENDFNKRNLLLCDLIDKLSKIDKRKREGYFLKGVLNYLPEELKEYCASHLHALDSTQKTTKNVVDIAIFTVIPNELQAVLHVFGIPFNKECDAEVNNLRIWNTQISSKAEKKDINIIITMIGEPRNVESAAACYDILTNYSVKTSVLLGIAAGSKKQKIGDVIAANIIWDYEGGRIEPDEFRKRPTPHVISRHNFKNLAYFCPEYHDWQDIVNKQINSIKQTPQIKQKLRQTRKIKPNFKVASILCGEKLCADDGIDALRYEYDERIRALEMEGHGFAFACENKGVPWLDFRGISDLGDEESKGSSQAPNCNKNKDKNQLLAAISAATLLKVYLENHFRFNERK